MNERLVEVVAILLVDNARVEQIAKAQGSYPVSWSRMTDQERWRDEARALLRGVEQSSDATFAEAIRLFGREGE